MIVDYVASLGHFAFRRVPFNDPSGLLRLMDRVGIDKALVSSLEAVMFRNVQSGNEILSENLKGYRQRLIPAAVVNPVYPGSLEDLEYCVSSLDMKAVKLYPTHHDYSLADKDVHRILEGASERGVPVSIALRVEDERQRHPLTKLGEAWSGVLLTDHVAEAIKNHPNTTFALERFSWAEFNRVFDATQGCHNYLVEISGRFMHGSPHDHVRQLIEKIGATRVLFGTDIPLQYPEPALLKIETMEPPLAREERALIMGGNAVSLLHLSK